MALPAWAADLWVTIGPYVERLAVWRGYEAELETLVIYGLGITLYTALVFTFYNLVSRRRPIQFRASGADNWGGRMSRFAERALAFPLTSFLYFAVIALALFVMAKEQTVPQIMRVAMAVIVSVRVTVYLSEGMSNDLSKLVPLSLLAVVLVDPGYLTLGAAWDRILQATQLWPLLGRYFLLFIFLEAVMSSARWTILRAGERWGDARIPRRAKETMHRLQVTDPNAPRMPPKAP